MPMFHCTYEILPEHRANCMAVFGAMTEDDFKRDAGECNIVGRWHSPGSASGSVLIEAPSSTAIGSHLQNWITMVTIHATPVVDDNMARKIIFKGEKPSWQATYHKVGHEAPEGYSLYTIDFKIDFAQRSACYAALGAMTKEQHMAQEGHVIHMGRYHNIGMGTGICICAAKSEYDLQKWCYNWNSMADNSIQPVMSDKEWGDMIKSKPNFALDLIKAKAATGKA